MTIACMYVDGNCAVAPAGTRQPAPVKGKMYSCQTMYDPASGIPVIDVLLPEGWSGSVAVDWNNMSTSNPGVAITTLKAPDGTASIYIYSI